MSLKFFADRCVTNSVIQYLRDAGHEILRLKHVRIYFYKINLARKRM